MVSNAIVEETCFLNVLDQNIDFYMATMFLIVTMVGIASINFFKIPL